MELLTLGEMEMDAVHRTLIHAWIWTLLFATTSSAQEWAVKMFDETAHDFGTIARGSKAEHRFRLTNPYRRTVHIAEVRSSCGCTVPTIANPRLRASESGEIVAEFNTIGYSGPHSATLTVVLDEPFRAEVQLKVDGNVQNDLLFSPGSVRFASIDAGTASDKKRVSAVYTGGENWRITEVRSTNPNVEVALNETVREAGKVSYDLIIRITEHAAPGYLNEQLVLVTNDQKAPRIPLQVEARIRPETTVTPCRLVLGKVSVGTTVTKRIVVRGKHPFRIIGVDCDHKAFSFQLPEEAKALHLLEVAFSPQQKSGDIRETIRIRTDRPGIESTLVVSGTVVDEEEHLP